MTLPMAAAAAAETAADGCDGCGGGVAEAMEPMCGRPEGSSDAMAAAEAALFWGWNGVRCVRMVWVVYKEHI